MTVVAAGRLVLPGRVTPGWIRLDGTRIVAVSDGPAPPDVDVDLGDACVLPGFVDIHCHGGGGAAFTVGEQEQAETAAAFHLRHGTTSVVGSLVTAPVDALVEQAAVLRGLVRDGVLAGLHYEGPFLSSRRCGAQDPAHLRDPDPAAFDRLVAAAGGVPAMMTIAPELPGAVDLVRRCASAGFVAAVGHTDATYDEARAAIDAGARVATHLFNGMRPLHHREPGPVLACLSAPEVTCELVNDGIHLDGRVAAFAAGASDVCLVTDAISAAGMSDGSYQLGSMAVRVSDGAARLADGGTIAGSTLTMDVAVRRAVLDVGLPLPRVAEAAALAPARAFGLAEEVGSLEVGKRADLVVLDAETLDLRAVMRAGSWVAAP